MKESKPANGRSLVCVLLSCRVNWDIPRTCYVAIQSQHEKNHDHYYHCERDLAPKVKVSQPLHLSLSFLLILDSLVGPMPQQI